MAKQAVSINVLFKSWGNCSEVQLLHCCCKLALQLHYYMPLLFVIDCQVVEILWLPPDFTGCVASQKRNTVLVCASLSDPGVWACVCLQMFRLGVQMPPQGACLTG
jgi:hypothetical protein